MHVPRVRPAVCIKTIAKPVVEPGSVSLCCETPLRDKKQQCPTCRDVGPFANCGERGHMVLCDSADIYAACNHCQRILCTTHIDDCYCYKRLTEPKFRAYRLDLLRSKPGNSLLKSPQAQPSSSDTSSSTTANPANIADHSLGVPRNRNLQGPQCKACSRPQPLHRDGGT